MVMNQDCGSSVAENEGLEHLTRMHGGTIEGTEAYQIQASRSIPSIEHDDPEGLTVEIRQHWQHQVHDITAPPQLAVPGRRDAAFFNEQ